MDILTKYEDAVKNYNEIADLAENIYNQLKKTDEVKIGKKKLFENFDTYIQSLLAIVAFGDGIVTEEELAFIKQITRYHDNYARNYSKTLNLNPELLETVKNEATKVLEEVPYFIQMLAVVDKTSLEAGNVSEYCRRVFKNLLSIILDLAAIDGRTEKAELEVAVTHLQPIITYFNVNEIKFME